MFVKLSHLAPIFIAILVATGCSSKLVKNKALLNQEQANDARQLIREAVDSKIVPGFVAQIYQDNQLVFSDTYGFSSIDRNTELHHNDLFRIYSMTKPVTVVAALILLEQGKLKLDDEVSRYIPEFNNIRVFGSGKDRLSMQTVALEHPITIRHLMTHTAGFTYGLSPLNPVMEDYLYKGIPTGSGFDKAPLNSSNPVASLEEFSQRIAEAPIMHQPGSDWTYGNSIDVLGRVVEVASGKRLATYMQDEIFYPLGMTDTSFIVTQSQSNRFTDLFVSKGNKPAPQGTILTRQQYWPKNVSLVTIDSGQKSVYSKQRNMDFGGAGLVSTIDDYAKFSLMLLNNGSYKGQTVISPESVASMRANHLTPEALKNSEYGENGILFGLGVGIIEDNSQLSVCMPKGGYFWGGAASTYFFVDPINNSTIMLFTQVFGDHVRPVWGELLKLVYGEPKQSETSMGCS
jgi:CubicO group peptidase (beta-lactamase class C family)